MIKLGWQVGGNLKRSWDKTCDWAASLKVQTVEIPAGPNAPFCNVDKVLSGQRSTVLEPLKRNSIELSTLIYCVNNLNPNENERKKLNAHMRKVIETAQVLEAPIVACFIGNCFGDYAKNYSAFENYFIPLLQFAKDHQIKMAIENCHAGGLNIGASPNFWPELFQLGELHHLDNLGLEFDPSHLAWQAQNYEELLDLWANKGKIFCMHAKDTTFMPEQRNWWRFTIPGRGTISWSNLFRLLNKAKFSGAVLIEHEDSEYSGKKYDEGIAKAMENLQTALKNA